MQEIDVTPQLLIEFSTEYAKVPIVGVGGDLKGIPFTHQVLACWISNIQARQDNLMYQVFTGWLCGRGQFIHPDTPSGVIMEALAAALRPIVEQEDDS